MSFLFVGQSHYLRCPKSLGMAYDVHSISDEQINASSWLNENVTPQHGRLNNPTSAWCAHNLDANPIFRVTFNETLTLIAAAIQGDPVNGNNYVEELSIHTQEPGKDFKLFNHVRTRIVS